MAGPAWGRAMGYAPNGKDDIFANSFAPRASFVILFLKKETKWVSIYACARAIIPRCTTQRPLYGRAVDGGVV